VSLCLASTFEAGQKTFMPDTSEICPFSLSRTKAKVARHGTG